MTILYEDDARAEAFLDDGDFEGHVIAAIRENRAREFERELRKEFPDLVPYCEHVKRMLEAISCPPEERHVYDPVCWSCRIEKSEQRR